MCTLLSEQWCLAAGCCEPRGQLTQLAMALVIRTGNPSTITNARPSFMKEIIVIGLLIYIFVVQYAIAASSTITP